MKKVIIYQEDDPMFRINPDKDYKKLEGYHQVYEHDYDVSDDLEDKVFLEILFEAFNRGNYPEDYKGHSMSVADIVSIDGRLWLCDSIGWTQL